MKRRDHIHSVIVSYNRGELTEQTIHSYVETVTIPFTLLVMDNGSDEATVERLRLIVSKYQTDSDITIQLSLIGSNRYPGFATNRGWEVMPPQTTLLHRSDNDFEFLPGWCDEVVAAFQNRAVGQVGLRTDEEEVWNHNNVGGNCVIRRKLWDKGLRYDERPWGEGYDPGWTEDSLMSPEVVRMGYRWTRVKQPCLRWLSTDDPEDPYYQRSWAIRGITPPGGTT